MTPLDFLDQLRFQRDVEHLHSLGPRSTAELLTEAGNRSGAMAYIIDLLTEYRSLRPEALRMTGGDRFPPRPFRLVPRDLGRGAW